MCLRICFGKKPKVQRRESLADATPMPSPSAKDPPAAEALQSVPNRPPISNPPVADSTPIVSPQVGSQLQIPPIPADLPSQVEETLAACPRFRIVLIGNSGVGKSSLVRNIFNIDPNKIDVAHGRAGDADIEREYMSSENPRFILHDSKGFEAGSMVNWAEVDRFLRRSQAYPDLSRRIHAIWFCIETPRTGARLLQTGGEMLLDLAKTLNIPIIAVFTKYDLLVRQCFKNRDPEKPKAERTDDAEKQALASFNRSVKELRAVSPIRCMRTSQNDSNQREKLIELTNVTRTMLHDVEGELWIPWATAQQVSARQKVELSISEGFKKYWLDLGQSIAFEGQTLINCVHRIHDDVLKVWNFYDPRKILSGTRFFAEMIAFVKPIIEDQVNHTSSPGDPVSTWANLAAIVEATGATVLVTPLSAIGLSVMAGKYLYDKYQRYPSTAKLLATYIVNLILILHTIFMDVLPSDPPRALSYPLVFDALARHKADFQTKMLDNINSTPGFATSPEKVIASVIKEHLGFPHEDSQ